MTPLADNLIVSTILQGTSSSLHCTGKFISSEHDVQIVIPRGNGINLYGLSPTGLVPLSTSPLFRSISSLHPLSLPSSSPFTSLAFITPSSELGVFHFEQSSHNSIKLKLDAIGSITTRQCLGSPLEKNHLTVLNHPSCPILVSATASGRLSFSPLSSKSSSILSHHIPIEEVTITSMGVVPDSMMIYVLGDVAEPSMRKRRLSVYKADFDESQSIVLLSKHTFYDVPSDSSFALPLNISGEVSFFIAGPNYISLVSSINTKHFESNNSDVTCAVVSSEVQLVYFDGRGKLFEFRVNDGIVREIPIKMIDDVDRLTSIDSLITSSSLLVKKDNLTTVLAVSPYTNSYLINIPFNVHLELSPSSYAATAAPCLPSCAPISSLASLNDSLVAAVGTLGGGGVLNLKRGSEFVSFSNIEVGSPLIPFFVDGFLILSGGGTAALKLVGDESGVLDLQEVERLPNWEMEAESIGVGLINGDVMAQVTNRKVNTSQAGLSWSTDQNSLILTCCFHNNSIFLSLDNDSLIALSSDLTPLSVTLPSAAVTISAFEGYLFVGCWSGELMMFSEGLDVIGHLPAIPFSQAKPRHSTFMRFGSTLYLFISLADGHVGFRSVSNPLDCHSDWTWFHLSSVESRFCPVHNQNESYLLALSDTNYLIKTVNSKPIPLYLNFQSAVAGVYCQVVPSPFVAISTTNSVYFGSINTKPLIHSSFSSLNHLTPRRVARVPETSSVVVSGSRIESQRGHVFKSFGSFAKVWGSESGVFSDFYNLDQHDSVVTGCCCFFNEKSDSFFTILAVANEVLRFSSIIIFKSKDKTSWEKVADFELKKGLVFSLLHIPSPNPTFSVGFNAQVFIYEIDPVSFDCIVLAELLTQFFAYSQSLAGNFLAIGDYTASVTLTKLIRNNKGKVEKIQEVSRDFKPLSCKSLYLIDKNTAIASATQGKIHLMSFPHDAASSTFARRGQSIHYHSNVSCFNSVDSLYPSSLQAVSFVKPLVVGGCVDGSLLLFSTLSNDVAIRFRELSKLLSGLFRLEISDSLIINGDLIALIPAMSPNEQKTIALKVGIDHAEMMQLIDGYLSSI
ncbi:hypothetical protein P9112_012069 [Eukaryota sp. TZLM1-RC]